jgi:hypothetical protein
MGCGCSVADDDFRVHVSPSTLEQRKDDASKLRSGFKKAQVSSDGFLDVASLKVWPTDCELPHASAAAAWRPAVSRPSTHHLTRAVHVWCRRDGCTCVNCRCSNGAV